MTSTSVASPIRILLIHQQTVVREGVRMLLEKRSNMKIVGETGEWQSGISLASRLHPDIILLSLRMETNSSHASVESFPDLKQMAPQARILVLTGSQEIDLHLRALEQGALGLIRKHESSELLIKAIEKVHAGEAWIDHKLMATFLAGISRNKGNHRGPPDSEEPRLAALTTREKEIALLLAQGLNPRQIGERLYISYHTVRNHTASIYQKLEVANRFDLTLFLYRHKQANSADQVQSRPQLDAKRQRSK
jgi:DNA-binding NarL/FixJ family response regulator